MAERLETSAPAARAAVRRLPWSGSSPGVTSRSYWGSVVRGGRLGPRALRAGAWSADGCYHESALTGANERQPIATATAKAPANGREHANNRKRRYSRLPARQAGGHWFGSVPPITGKPCVPVDMPSASAETSAPGGGRYGNALQPGRHAGDQFRRCACRRTILRPSVRRA
jgi:hypothetical protein